MEKKISVVIPCFNCSDTIIKTWDSLKKQTIGIDNLECVFVDDASSDDGHTWMILEQIESECPDSVMIIHLDKNMRQGGARNVGITYATSEYLMFLDSDDEFVDNACEIAYGCIKNTDSDIVQFNHVYRLGNRTRVTNESDSNGVYVISGHDDRIKFLNSSLVTYGCTNKIYRLELIRQVKAVFAERAVYEEPLFVYPCFLYANKVSLITDALYIYNIVKFSRFFTKNVKIP